jgi:hypothetical protein
MSFTKDSATTTNRVSLANSTNWEMWHQDFKSKAVGYDMWNYVQGIKELEPNPERPTYANYAIKRTAAIARTTRTQSVTETQDTIEEQSAETVFAERPTPQPSNVVSTKNPTFGDLTAEGQKAYQAAWSFYQDDMKIYREQQDFLRKLKDWVTDTISPHYRRLCCEPTDPLPKWYKSLKEAVGVTSYMEKKEATRLYQEAIRSPKSLKDFDKWIDNWEQGINLAQIKKVAATLSPSDWFNDLMNTLAGILPNWSESYAIHKGDEVENGTITFRVVANDLRKVVDRKQKGTTKIAKGSFGPTFAEVEHTEEGPKNNLGPTNSPGPAENSPRPTNSPRSKNSPSNFSMDKQRKKGNRYSSIKRAPLKRTASHMQQRDSEGVRATSHVCRACDGFHSTRRCFYLFPDSRPRGWIPNKRIRGLVDNNLKEDSTLAEEVKRWTKEKDSGENYD